MTTLWLRIELRRRWRPLLGLTLMVAVSAAVVLTATAGARRGDSAAERLAVATRPATALIQPAGHAPDWAAVRALPAVEALSLIAIASQYGIDGVDDPFAHGLAADAVMGRDMEVPMVRAGRLADPGRADEVVVTPGFAEHYGLAVGDPVTLRLYDPDTVDTAVRTGAVPDRPDGLVIVARVVGVVVSPWLRDEAGGTGQLQPSAALFVQYRDNLLGGAAEVPVGAMVRLVGGAAALPAFADELAALTGTGDTELMDLSAEAAQAADTTSFESVVLLAFGLAALAAAAVLVGQATARYLAVAVTELRALRPCGLRPVQAVAWATAGPVTALVCGITFAVGLAVVGSAWFPIGSAGPLEPEPGAAVDPLVLGLGAPLLAVVGVAGCALAAAALTARPVPAQRPSAVAALAARIGLPVAVTIGARMALEPGRGPTALPVRPALVGAVAGVFGVLAAATFSAGVTDSATDPARFGQTQQLELVTAFDGEQFGAPTDQQVAVVTADPDVAAVLDASIGTMQSAAGPITLVAHRPVTPGSYPTVLTAGRMVAGPDEVVLAPVTADELGARVGARVRLVGDTEGDLLVTGIGFVPHAGTEDYDTGGWLSGAGFDRLVGSERSRIALIVLRPGADPEIVGTRLAAAVAALSGAAPDGVQLTVTPLPPEATQIRNVEVLPRVLGGFVALLAVGAVGHALATAVRRRRRDLAVLRVLGMTGRQVRATVTVQALVLAGFGLLFGLPLGVAVGRALWRLVADITPLQYVPPPVALPLLLAVPVAGLVAVALAAVPGRRAARLRIATVLRAE